MRPIARVSRPSSRGDLSFLPTGEVLPGSRSGGGNPLWCKTAPAPYEKDYGWFYGLHHCPEEGRVEGDVGLHVSAVSYVRKKFFISVPEETVVRPYGSVLVPSDIGVR